MLRKTLGEIVETVRGLAGLSTNTSRGIDAGDHIRGLIRARYEMLAEDHDWPHLDLRRGDSFKTMAAGQRYYDLPTELNPQKITGAHVKWGASWVPLTYGIGNEEYSALDSDEDARAVPIICWRLYSNDDLNQFEVWPIPASDGDTVSFEGQRAVTALNEDEDRADMDHLAIAWDVAATLLRKSHKELAAEYTDKAAKRVAQLLGNTRTESRRYIIGGQDPNMVRPTWPRQIKFVRVG